MCILGSGGVKEQCGRKYWGDGREARVTELYKLPLEKKKNLPLENLNCERYLAKFGILAAQFAACSNNFFKALGIQDDLMFWNSNPLQENTEKCSKLIISELDEIEMK